MAKNTFMIIDPELGNVDLFNEHPVKIEDFKKHLFEKDWVTINGNHVFIGKDGGAVGSRTLYHGTTAENAQAIESGGIENRLHGQGTGRAASGEGMYLAKNPKAASSYGDKVVEMHVPSNLKFYNGDMLSVRQDIYESTKGKVPFDNITGKVISDYLAGKGYDGVEHEDEVVVFNPKNIHVTKKSLQKGWVTINGAHVLIGEDGEPAETAYRGSDSGKIDINRTGEHGSVDGKGIYLSTSQEVASRYGKVRTHAIDKSSLIFDDKKLSQKQVTSLQKVVGKDYLNWNKVPNGKWLFERLNLTHKNPEKILQIAGINGIRFTPIVKGGANYKNYLLFNKKPIIDTVGKTVEKGWVTVNGQHRFYDDSGTGGNAHRGGAGTAVADAPTQIAYAPASNLTPDERAVEERFGRQLTDNPDQAIQEYEDRFDHELNTDNARELSPDYSASKDSRSQYARAVHEPASALTKEMYARDLEMPTPEGKQKMVLFTAGGTGSGKTSALRDIPEMQNLKSSAKLTYDTNMNTFSSAKSKIDQALATGHNVAIAYVNRDPVESLMLGAVPRAERMGRTVPLAEHVKTHVGSINTVKALASHYANNPHVKISVIDNTRGRGGATVSSLDSLNKINYNSTELTSQLNGALDRAYAEGQVSTSVYNGFKGL